MKKIVTNEAFYRWVMLLLAIASLIVGIMQVA
jgi:hypothetical protein